MWSVFTNISNDYIICNTPSDCLSFINIAILGNSFCFCACPVVAHYLPLKIMKWTGNLNLYNFFAMGRLKELGVAREGPLNIVTSYPTGNKFPPFFTYWCYLSIKKVHRALYLVLFIIQVKKLKIFVLCKSRGCALLGLPFIFCRWVLKSLTTL